MTDLITSEAAGKLLDGTTPGPWWYFRANSYDPQVKSAMGAVCDIGGYVEPNPANKHDIANAHLIAAAPDLARIVIALHAQLADAKAAQAMVVERVAEVVPDCGQCGCQSTIRALADTDGLALVQSLRAERDDAVAVLRTRESSAAVRTVGRALRRMSAAEADRDRLAAANAALEAQVARLVWLLRQHYDAQGEDLSPGKFNRLMSRTEAALAEVQADAQRKGDDA